MNEKLISAVLQYGERYRQEFLLPHYAPDQLREDWWVALKFFFGRAFFQGRRDAVSAKVYEAAVAVLDQATSEAGHQVRDLDYQRLKVSLSERIGPGMVGKGRDVEMVLSALRFAERLPQANFILYTLDRICSGHVADHYEELQWAYARGGIVQVGPKIAAFYLRDVVSLFGLERQVPAKAVWRLQPVDVWVRKVAERSGLVPRGTSDTKIAQAIVALCEQRGHSAVTFNMGAWYAGYHAFDLLLELLAH